MVLRRALSSCRSSVACISATLNSAPDHARGERRTCLLARRDAISRSRYAGAYAGSVTPGTRIVVTAHILASQRRQTGSCKSLVKFVVPPPPRARNHRRGWRAWPRMATAWAASSSSCVEQFNMLRYYDQSQISVRRRRTPTISQQKLIYGRREGVLRLAPGPPKFGVQSRDCDCLVQSGARGHTEE